MDISLALEFIKPNAEYFGSLTDNTQDSYDNLVWLDELPKPTWDEIIAAHESVIEASAAKDLERANLLERLGITEAEAKLLLG
jgi:hypothetical protein